MTASAASTTPSTPRIAMLNLLRQRAALEPTLNDAIAAVLDHGQFIMGPEVLELERSLCEYTGARFCVTCANGTDALVLALMALGVGEGDVVLVPSFTFVATAEAVALRGATPLFVDVQPDTFNVDPDAVEETLTWANEQGLRVRALITVDLFGRPADYPTLRRVCDRHGVTLVADAAQSFGAATAEGRVGTLADLTTTSFFPSKPLGCFGDGGALFTDDEVLANTLASLRQHGKGVDKYDNVRLGLNSRLDTLQAAVLLAKLGALESELEQRSRLATTYRRGLSTLPWVTTPSTDDRTRSAWAQYTLRLGRGVERSTLAAHLGEVGVATAVYYPIPLHQQGAYRHFPQQPGGLPVSEGLSRQVLSLPMDPYLSDDEARLVVERVACFQPSREPRT